MNYVYIARCADGTLYTGWTTDLIKREKTHNDGKGAKYTKSRTPIKIVYSEVFDDKETAMSREWHIKRLTRAEKLKLIENANEDNL